MSKTISKILLNGEEYNVKDANLTDRVSSIEAVIGDGIDVDLSGFYTKTQVDNKFTTFGNDVDTKINSKVAEIVGGAPEQLDTLKEIADTLNKDTEGGVVNAIFTKIDSDKTELSDRIDVLEAIDHTDFVTSDDLTAYPKTTEMNTKFTQFATEISDEYVSKDDFADAEKEIKDGIDDINTKAEANSAAIQTLQTNLNTVTASVNDHEDRLDALEGVTIPDAYSKSEVDTKITTLANAVDTTLQNYATVANLTDIANQTNGRITNLQTKVYSQTTVAVHRNGDFLNPQTGVMYFIFDEEGDETDGRTPLKIKAIDNSDGGVDFASGELITISNEQTQEQFIQPINYFTSGPVDTVLAKETDTISVMCGSAQYGVVAFNACPNNQYIALEITASTTDRVVNGGAYWVENDQPVNGGPIVPPPSSSENEKTEKILSIHPFENEHPDGYYLRTYSLEDDIEGDIVPLNIQPNETAVKDYIVDANADGAYIYDGLTIYKEEFGTGDENIKFASQGYVPVLFTSSIGRALGFSVPSEYKSYYVRVLYRQGRFKNMNFVYDENTWSVFKTKVTGKCLLIIAAPNHSGSDYSFSITDSSDDIIYSTENLAQFTYNTIYVDDVRFRIEQDVIEVE